MPQAMIIGVTEWVGIFLMPTKTKKLQATAQLFYHHGSMGHWHWPMTHWPISISGSQYTNVTDRKTDWRTDNLPWHNAINIAWLSLGSCEILLAYLLKCLLACSCRWCVVYYEVKLLTAGVYLIFLGRARVHWTEHRRQGKRSQTRSYNSWETYVDRKLYAFGSGEWIFDSAPSLRVYYFLSLTLSVCMSLRLSRCSFKSILLLCFSMESSHFWPSVLHVALYKTFSSIFDLGP